jgi:EmrB/QacA subfamily drug resistance transporter
MRDTRRWWALAALNLAVLAVSLDGTVLSVALPTLAHALDATESDLQWFSSGYLLVLAAAMLPAGLLGDRYGRKRVLLVSVALFGAGSALCAAAPSSGAFIAARGLLGLAGAGVIVMALSALTVLFSEAERPKAVGVWSAANFVALPLGPILGGWLLSEFWWGWVFLINVPVAIIGLLATWRLVPDSRAAHRPGIDGLGLAASVAGLLALTYGVIAAGEHGWGHAGAVLPIAAGVALLAAFAAWERRLGTRPGGEPLIDPALFSSHGYTWGVILATVAILAMIGVLFTLPQYFQGVRGTDAMGSGVRLLPLIGGLVLGALPADRLAVRAGAKATVALGFLILAGGLAVGATTDLRSGEGFVAAWMAVVGLGMGLTTATATAAALSELPEERSGVGSAVLQACNKTGGPLGTAILGSVLSSAYLSRLDVAGLPAAARESVFGGVAAAERAHSGALLVAVRGAFVHGMDAALLVSAAIAAAGALATLAFLRTRRAVVGAAQ